MKLWNINEFDYVAAQNKEEAIECYKEFLDLDEDDFEIKELTDEEMEKLTFVEDIDNPEKGPKKTFKQKLNERIAAGDEFPDFFASSEY